MTHDTAEGIPAWRRWAVGTRVVVRHRLPDGRLTDALGELAEVDDAGLMIATRRGPVRVAGADVVLGKPVPPPPPRRGPRAVGDRGVAGDAQP
ncbi:hypothetical protein [uncultured Cellulomonas sp.]|uniref:putative acetyltransferase n=1 Tax=uncultured Cellulomonas sp. TaxID=189682 RepID=UPI0026272A0E|nr:hypothetical protein [uncultured Cellulomonas sp.]